VVGGAHPTCQHVQIESLNTSQVLAFWQRGVLKKRTNLQMEDTYIYGTT
jgi:hypothetical protein